MPQKRTQRTITIYDKNLYMRLNTLRKTSSDLSWSEFFMFTAWFLMNYEKIAKMAKDPEQATQIGKMLYQKAQEIRMRKQRGESMI